jgi:hypothetical protein
MADSLSGASAPAVVSTPAASATVSTDAQSLYADASKALTGQTWAEYETVAGTAVAEPETPPEAAEPEATGERPRNPDGTFKAKETDEPAAPEGETPTEPEVTEPVVAEEPEPFLLTIPSRQAGEADVEIPFAGLTEQQQQDLNRLRNGYMRGEDIRAKQAALDGKLAELNAFETMLSENPEHVILNALSEPKRISILTKLIAQYWDEVVPTIQQFDTDPIARVKQASKTQLELRDNQKAYEATIARQQAASEIRTVLLAQIPDGTDDDTADRFYADAVNAIRVAESRGTNVTTKNLPDILAHHVKLYGFANAPQSPASPKPAVARAVVKGAAPVAAKAPEPSPEQAALEQARKGQARLTQTVVAQRRAASVPPAGAGAAPVRLPPVPSGADIETASRELKKAGRSWANL